MSAGIWFWILYVVFLLVSCFIYYPYPEPYRRHAGVSLVVFILIGLLGWGIFGAPLK